MPMISPYAVVWNPANLADDVVVGAFCYIGPDVVVGPGTRIHNNVTLDGCVRIGAGNTIYPFAVIGQAGAEGEPPRQVCIGDRNSLREHVVIRAGRPDAEGPTRIGHDNLIMTGCFIGPGVRVEDQVVLDNYTQLGERTHVEKYVRASGFTGTRAGTTIGAYTFTSGYAGIDRDAPPFARVQGFPFKVRGVNTLNLKRQGFTQEQISELEEVFRHLFNGSGQCPPRDRIDELGERARLGEHVRYLLKFLERPAGRVSPDTADTSAGQAVGDE